MMICLAGLLSLRIIWPSLILVQLLRIGTGYKLRCDDDYDRHRASSPAWIQSSHYSMPYGDIIRDESFFSPDGRRQGPLPCKKATTNPQGYYTARLDNCIIRFHSIPATETKGTEGRYKLTTACSDQNLAADKANSELEWRLQQWPDECVADFGRCYSVDLHENTFKQIACQLKWQLPEETTHISVNCTADALAREKAHNETAPMYGQPYDPNDPYQQHQRAKRREIYLVVIVCIGMVLFACCFMFCLTHRLVVRPFFETWRLGGLERTRLTRKDKDEDFDDEALVSKGTELRQRSAAGKY